MEQGNGNISFDDMTGKILLLKFVARQTPETAVGPDLPAGRSLLDLSNESV
jgi:hypothetical protein